MKVNRIKNYPKSKKLTVLKPINKEKKLNKYDDDIVKMSDLLILQAPSYVNNTKNLKVVKENNKIKNGLKVVKDVADFAVDFTKELSLFLCEAIMFEIVEPIKNLYNICKGKL